MIRINLLPYRPERRQKQILEHLVWLFGAIASVVVLMFMLNMYGNGQLNGLQDEFATIQAQNRELKKKIGKIRNLDKLRVEVERKLALVDELQQGRYESLNTLYRLARLIPENVWLSSIVDNAGQLKFHGFAESNKAVANFMRALDESPLFDNIDLNVITRKEIDGTAVRSFDLRLSRSAKQIDKKNKGGK